ncbi:MAG: hypothetical protein GOV15_00640, partial [Candidatus Diapherotrites archaeon]|nr:hypothetical protein [Candidatus Diapherotrites archaeon]
MKKSILLLLILLFSPLALAAANFTVVETVSPSSDLNYSQTTTHSILVSNDGNEVGTFTISMFLTNLSLESGSESYDDNISQGEDKTYNWTYKASVCDVNIDGIADLTLDSSTNDPDDIVKSIGIANCEFVITGSEDLVTVSPEVAQTSI